MNFGKRGLMRFLRKRLNKVVAETSMLECMGELGFQHVDIQPNMQHSAASCSTLKEHQLKVACMSLSFFAPDKGTLHSKDPAAVNPLMDYLKAGIDHTAHLGIDRAYVVPGKANDVISLTDIAPHYAELAEYSAKKGVKIGIEHFPETALPTVKSTLEFIEQVNHPNLYLLFDIGHAQISNEDPADLLPDAGDRLLYVHLDDNDGKEDLHLSLTEGVQTRKDLESLFTVLENMNYSGPVSLELHPMLPDPFQALKESKQIVEELYDFS